MSQNAQQSAGSQLTDDMLDAYLSSRFGTADTMSSPFKIAMAFIAGLSDPLRYKDVLSGMIVTSERSDFDLVAASMMLTGRVVSTSMRFKVDLGARGERLMAFVDLPRMAMTTSGELLEEIQMSDLAVLTLVWADDRSTWLVEKLETQA